MEALNTPGENDVYARFDEGGIARRRLFERLGIGLLGLATLLAAVPALLIVGLLVVRGSPALTWTFLTAMPISGMTAGGILPAIVGTIWLVSVSLLFAVPVGVLAGVYLSEYAGDGWLAKSVDLAIVNLAAVPSIVHALFGLGAFVLFFNMGTSILAAGLTLGIMTLPVIITSTKASLRSVPYTFRIASWNLGVTRWQTIRYIVLPNALPGILTGIILQVSRAAGETAPILFTGATVFLPLLPKLDVADCVTTGSDCAVTNQTMALSMHVYALVTQIQNVPDSMKYGTALVLVITVLIFNSVAILLRLWLRYRRKW